jgi:SM-20-related protein
MPSMMSSTPIPQPSHQPLMPPYCIKRDFLDEGLVSELLAWVSTQEARFTPTAVYDGVRPDFRRSLKLPDLGPLWPRLWEPMSVLPPALVAEHYVQPFEPVRVEAELVAHGDGAFFGQHVDTMTEGVPELPGQYRLLSGVYYFHRAPKAFDGGCLRMYPIALNTGYVDIEPLHNTLVAFPSWAVHEVLPVGVPSRQFMDSRFAINIWFYGRL